MIRNRWEYRTSFFLHKYGFEFGFLYRTRGIIGFFEDKFEFGSLFLKQVVRLLLNININLKLVLKINIALNLNIDLEKL